MYPETSKGDVPFAKVRVLRSDMIASLDEKASADATHKGEEISVWTFEGLLAGHELASQVIGSCTTEASEWDEWQRFRTEELVNNCQAQYWCQTRFWWMSSSTTVWRKERSMNFAGRVNSRGDCGLTQS